MDNNNLMVKLNDDEQEELEKQCTDTLEWIEHNSELEKAQF
jgi:hypothetical protein